MAAAAHTKGGYGGVSQKVGREFNQADEGSQMLKDAMRMRNMRHKASSGPNMTGPSWQPQGG